MNFALKTTSTATASPSQFAAKPILALFAQKHSAIWHSARLLGGYEASRLVDRCAMALEQEAVITHRVHIMLNQILAILSLEKTDDPDLPYMGFFAAIDPWDPIVEEICVLTDALRYAISEAAARQRWADAQKCDEEAA